MAGFQDEEVKTLFLSGLPDDIKEREIYNLFRTHKGYESCQLKYSGRGYQVTVTPLSRMLPLALALSFLCQ
jgi:hypothetical protein